MKELCRADKRLLPFCGTRVQCLNAPASEAVKSLRALALARSLMADDERQASGKYLSQKLAPYIGENIEYKARLYWDIVGGNRSMCCCCC